MHDHTIRIFRAIVREDNAIAHLFAVERQRPGKDVWRFVRVDIVKVLVIVLFNSLSVECYVGYDRVEQKSAE